MKRIFSLTPAFLLTLLAGSVSLSASTISYVVNVDTSSISGQSGIVDFQFIAGDTDADAALASVSSFATDGTLSGSSLTDGTVLPANADLPGDFAISDDPSQNLNDLYQSLTFGNSLSFLLTLSGDAFDNPNPLNSSGSTFSLSFYTPGFGAALLTSNPDGAVTDVGIAPGGAISVETAPVASIAATPEPGTLVLLGAGLVATVGLRRRYRLPR